MKPQPNRYTQFLSMLVLLAVFPFQILAPHQQDFPPDSNPAASQTKNLYIPFLQKPAKDWPMVAANPSRTSWTAEEVRGQLRPEWYRHFDAYISQKTQVIAANNSLYISTSAGLYALDSATGNVRWFYPTELPLGHSPTFAQGRVYVGGLDRQIHAVDANTGQGLWTFMAGAGFETNPLVIGDRLYAGNRDGNMYAVWTSGPSTGQLAWKFQTGGPILFSAAYSDQTIYFVSGDMFGYALNAHTGALVWKSAKLPGNGFYSWWPVIYGDYVVFPGSFNYRYPKPFGEHPHIVLETDGVYKNPDGSYMSDGTPVGRIGTEGGPWASGTKTINASRITNYFETYPQRRTFFVLSRKNGQELTFDSDHDGKKEYAPVLFVGAKSGTRYPPLVGADGVLYQSNNYISNRWIPRGQVSGWKPGTATISIPSPSTIAVDEPFAYSAGGNIIYYKLCCDREAGAFDLRQTGNWLYYDQGGNMLRRSLPELYDQGWDFAYWKHGDQSPPIPYQDRVYTINNNAVVAFSPNGGNPVLPLNQDLGRTTGEPAANVERSSTAAGLTFKVTASNTSWPLVIQQESYFSSDSFSSARARYFRLFEVAGSDSQNPTSLNNQNNSITTTFTSSFAGGQSLKSQISQRSPSILFDNSSSIYQLRGKLAGMAYATSSGVRVVTGSSTVNGSELSEGWLLVWDQPTDHRWSPMLITLQNRPNQAALSSSGLRLSFSAPARYLAVTPLYGLSSPKTNEPNTWLSGIPSQTIDRVRLLDRTARSIPTSVSESTAIDGVTGDAVLSYTYQYVEFPGAWSTAPLRLAYLPPQMALAAWNGSPIRINNAPLDQHRDLGFVTPVGRVAGVENASAVSVRLPGIAQYWRNPPSSPAAPFSGDPLQAKLAAEVRKMLAAGHLRPAYGLTGIWDTLARGTLGNNMADYWHNPAETIYTLIRALPLLPADLQAQVRAYIQSEFQAYPPYAISHVGWKTGAGRDFFDLPPEVQSEAANYPACAEYCDNGFPLPQENLYATWQYASQFGGAPGLFSQITSKLNTRPWFSQSTAYFLNGSIAGAAGYLRLAALANAGSQPAAEKYLIDLLVLRAALSKFPETLAQTGFEYGGYRWAVRVFSPNSADTLFSLRLIGTLWSQTPLYGFQMDPMYGLSGPGQGGAYGFGIDFVNLTPELAAFLHDYAFNETQAAVEDYTRRAPLWFVNRVAETGGEGVTQPVYDSVALFQAKAMILGESRASLEKYLDVPAVHVGDLYYIQNLIATLSAP